MILKNIIVTFAQIVDGFLTFIEISMLKLNEKVL